MAILFAVVIGGVVAGVYYFIQGRNSGPAASATKLENVPVAQDASLQSDPAMKYLEVAGIRLIQSDSKKVEMKFVVVNHSAAALSDVNARIRVVARDTQGVESVVGECIVKAGSIEPYASKEFTSPLNTDKKAYELPDWQFLRATVSAAGS